jgi:hypothetical protein
MDTKSTPSTQVQAQDVVPENEYGWPDVLRLSNFHQGEIVGYMQTDEPMWADAEIYPGEYIRADLTGWRPMTSAPAGDVRACIDIWSGPEDRRITDCFWDADLADWAVEIYTDLGDYRTIRVDSPTAWMPTPGKPEGL